MNDRPPSSSSSSDTVFVYDTTPLTSALANPYAHHFSPHYYQAYVQAYSNPRPPTTTDGYTLSSTYVPGTSRSTPTVPVPSPRDRPSVQAQSQTTVRPIQNHLAFGSWYQSGSCRCARQGCPFTGSRKSVEIHMMDRHFIFPPGWQKKDDWDADPSLRGKPIAIQGTSLVLDTPEAIDAWISERRRRFPTDEKVRDKKRKLEEAVARGQLTWENVGSSARKRYKQNTTPAEGGNKRFRGRGHQRGRGRRQGLARHEEPRTEIVNDSTDELVDSKTCTREVNRDPTSITEVDESPEIMSSKVPPTSPHILNVEAGVQTSHAYTQPYSRKASQPKKPPQNPFASRSTLLRNLLLPEIRATVSNLSQTIRFLVENNFLSDVELRPGEARGRMIEVLESCEAPSYQNCRT